MPKPSAPKRARSLRQAEAARRTGVTGPRFIEPCHPIERDRPPSGDKWVHEIKADGYRAQVHLRGGSVVVYSRRGHDWTQQFASVADAAGELPADGAILDGEAIVQDARGIADFQALRRELAKKAGHLTFYAFDLLFLNGKDLRHRPLVERKQQLKKLLAHAPSSILYAEHLAGDGAAVYAEACRMGLEGIISKRCDAPYRSGRQDTWVKIKCTKSGSYPIVAFVEKLGARPRRIASFYVGRWEGDRLLYAGKVRGGFTQREASEARERLDPLIVRKSPLSEHVVKPKATWVDPQVQAEVQYGSLTEEGLLRQSVFKALREDLAPPDRTRRISRRISDRLRGGVPRENILQLLPDAVVPSREELAAYWRKVAAHALPYLARRPLKLVRHTRAITFYHKGPLPPIPEAVHQLRIQKREGGAGIRLWVDDLAGLLGLVEIGAVELHPWAATIDDIERADALVFDLDPGEGISWEEVTETAFAVRRLLAYEGFDSWPKVTGGKGLHVTAPLDRKLSHDAAHAYAKKLAQRFAAGRPERYVTVADPNKRRGRTFIDYLRNGRGTTAVGAYSPRARPGFPIARPVTWTELERGIRPDAYTMDAPLRRRRSEA